MNVILAAQLYMLMAGIGGLGNGLLNYGGFAVPRIVRSTIDVKLRDTTKRVQVKLLMPGVIGNVMIGWISGLVVFLWAQGDAPVTQNLATSPTGVHLLGALLAGLLGTAFLDFVLDHFQQKTLERLEPEGEELPKHVMGQRTSVTMAMFSQQ